MESFEQLLRVVRQLQTSSLMWVECEEVDAEEDGHPVVSLSVMAGDENGSVAVIEVEADTVAIASQIVLNHLQQAVTTGPSAALTAEMN